MENTTDTNKSVSPPTHEGITRITVCGYKSISQEQSIEIRPLTILAGANSSGKSSIMQPLLLLKQTLEATYDPGALLLYGPNVRFTSTDQLFSRAEKGKRTGTFHVGMGFGSDTTLSIYFQKQHDRRIEISEMSYYNNEERNIFRLGMTRDDIIANISSNISGLKEFPTFLSKREFAKLKLTIIRNRCFLDLRIVGGNDNVVFKLGTSPSEIIQSEILQLIHLPGLRGNPERTYPVTAVGSPFPGTFEKYAASVIAQWQSDKKEDKLETLGKDLEKLGLSWKVTAKPINDTQVELQVGRLIRATRRGARDLINIADVGFGVSQALPVLVALHAANPGHLLYLEEPEIHLHPRAQSAMAQALADAANRGVRVVAETHSSLLLLGIQTLVAEGKLSPEIVKLHWFQRGKDGATEVKSADLDEAGAFGEWPEDFADVVLGAESRYLDAAEQRLQER